MENNKSISMWRSVSYTGKTDSNTAVHKFTIRKQSNISGVSLRSTLDDDVSVSISYPEQIDVISAGENAKLVEQNEENRKEIKPKTTQKKQMGDEFSFQITVSGKLKQGECIVIYLKSKENPVGQVGHNRRSNPNNPDDTTVKVPSSKHNDFVPESDTGM